MNNTAHAHKEAFRPEWAAILQSLVSEPGRIASFYSAFHNYSFGNQCLAAWQLDRAGIPIGPISTFKGWLDKGRCVQKGQKALALCVPVLVSAKPKPGEAQEGEDAGGGKRRIFVYRRGWFAVSQTAPLEGMEAQDGSAPVVMPTWEEPRALEALKITRAPFAHTNGNCQGYAQARTVAVNPVAGMPWKTLFHELAHVVLGHTAEALALEPDTEETPTTLREIEAEAVAFLCCQTLGLPGAPESRGYVQHWMQRHGADAIPEKSAAKIVRAADKILSAGAPAKVKAEAEPVAA